MKKGNSMYGEKKLEGRTNSVTSKKTPEAQVILERSFTLLKTKGRRTASAAALDQRGSVNPARVNRNPFKLKFRLTFRSEPSDRSIGPVIVITCKMGLEN